MKKLILLMSILALFSPISAQDYVELTFSDTFEDTSLSSTNVSAVSKEKRVGCRAPSIVITNEDELDEQTLKVVDYAMSVWEACIIGDIEFYIKVQLADIEEDIKTTVRYFQRNGQILPTSLDAYLNNLPKRESTTTDGIITINSNTIWDYSLGDNISEDKKNLSFGIMRAIARILGFGSSVQVAETGSYKFSDKRYHSIFDSMVSNSSNIGLTSISINRGQPSQDLKNYIEEENQTFWLNVGNSRYQLASPPYSKDYPPFVYIKDTNSLMSRDLYIGKYILNVDETTKTILNNIGWNTFPTPSVTIKGDDIDETGLASAYISHRFVIEKEDEFTIENPNWVLELPLANGEIQSIQLADDKFSCIVPPIDNEDDYKINSDGDIVATLNFTCNINGIETKDTFKIYLELKPFIESAIIKRIEDNSPYDSYNAYYEVAYRGSDRIQIYVEEEYSSKVKFNYIVEPYIAYGVADHITSLTYAWIDFVAENEYGKSVYTIELEPYGVVNEDNSGRMETRTSNARLVNDDIDNMFDVYDIIGNFIGHFTTLDALNNIQQKGIYIVKRIGNGTVETFKYINK